MVCTNYNVILLLKFETSWMVKKGRRKLNSKTARNMLSWSHYKFQQCLLFKQKEFPWCKVIIVTEEYTSKTCGECGHIHWGLGGSKLFSCPKCKIEFDRDANGSRNILLKFFEDNKLYQNKQTKSRLPHLEEPTLGLGPSPSGDAALDSVVDSVNLTIASSYRKLARIFTKVQETLPS